LAPIIKEVFFPHSSSRFRDGFGKRRTFAPRPLISTLTGALRAPRIASGKSLSLLVPLRFRE